MMFSRATSFLRNNLDEFYEFGSSVALSSDYIVVGAPGDGELRSDGDPVDTLGTDAGSSRTQPWGAT